MKQLTEADQFRAAMKLIVSVPKAEIDRREAEYRKQRKEAKKAKAA